MTDYEEMDYWTEQDRLADEEAAYRGSQLHEFFTAFDNANSDPSYLDQREQELGITEGEWQAYRAAKDAEVYF